MSTQEMLQEKRRDRLLGRSFRLDRIVPEYEIGRDIVLEHSGTGRDIAWVRGVENISQSLVIAFTTALGSDVFNVEFGFDGLNAVAEETNPILMRERIRIAIVRVLQKDARVRRILDVQLSDGRLESLVPNAFRSLEAIVSFEAVSGEQLIGNLGRALVHG